MVLVDCWSWLVAAELMDIGGLKSLAAECLETLCCVGDKVVLIVVHQCRAAQLF
jgi:hypothetical protein